MSYEIDQYKQGNTYSLNYWENFKTILTKKYATFSGRATRGEYWRFILVNCCMAILVGMAEKSVLGEPKGEWAQIYSLIMFFPGMAVLARRLHDVNKSAWWLLMNFLPLFGSLYLLYQAVKKGDVGPNRFGEDPMPR